MEKIKTREGFDVEINDEPLENGKPYVFRDKDSDEWWFGEIWRGDYLDSGGNPVLKTLNGNMVRKKVVFNK